MTFCGFSYSSALDWDSNKYKLPEEDPKWLSQVQPGTEEYSEICMAAKTRVLERVYEEKKQDFLQLVEIAGKIILAQNSHIVDAQYIQEWHRSFISAERSWLEQLSLEGKEYWYAEGSLGGNSSCRMQLFFMIEQIEQRMEKIKSRWWFKEQQNRRSHSS